MVEAKRKIPITELPIHIYKPMTEGRPYLAYIGDLPIRISAPTAVGAMKKAREFAKENCRFKPGTDEQDEDQ